MDWLVHERDARHDIGASRPRCLVFESDGAVRRVWSYPAHWHELSDADLLKLANAGVGNDLEHERSAEHHDQRP